MAKQQYTEEKGSAAEAIGKDVGKPEGPGEQHGPHVQEHGEGRIHLDEVHVQPSAVQDPGGLVEQEPGIRAGIAAEVGRETEGDEQPDGREKDRPPLERRPAHRHRLGGRQG